MKPQTKLHFEVVALNEKIKDVSESIKQWAYKKEFKHYAWKTKHTASCFECGHTWKVETNLISKLFGIECPKCKKTLEAKETRVYRHHAEGFFMVLTTVKNFQVVRIFQMHQNLAKGYEASYSCGEIIRHWIRSDGKITVLARDTCNFFYQTRWSWFGPFQVRGTKDKYYVNTKLVYPQRKILPEIIRNGYYGDTFGYHEAYLFHLILAYPIFETLLKTHQFKLAKTFYNHIIEFKEFWSQIKICIRHHYEVKDVSMWLDHLRMLKEFGKDIHNPEFVCPKDLKKEHQKLVDRKQRQIEREELKRLISKIEEADPVYRQDKEKYFGLKFSGGEIEIIVLNSVKEFFLEGKQLHHCVFNSKYYEKPNSLILSARKKGKRIETIEIDLRDFRIMQAHGNCHTVSKDRKQILEIIHANLDQIKKIKKRKVKQAVAA